LMLDCYGCSSEKLTDTVFLRDLLDEFPAKIKMTKVTSPCVFKYEAPAPQDSGVSGVVLISESHISLHTFPDKNHVFIDIFSCKEFDINFACQELVSLFGATHHEEKVSASHGTQIVC